MNKLLLAMLLLVSSIIARGQDNITIALERPSKLTGSAGKIFVSFEGQEVSLRNGSSTSINLPLPHPRVIEIKVKGQLYKASYSLHAIPGEVYSFEVGYGFKGVYINLISGNEDLIATSKVADDANYDWKSNLKRGQDGSLKFDAEKIHSSEEIRQEWLRKGGTIGYVSLGAVASYFSMDLEGFDPMNGYGGGLSYHYSWLNLNIPEYKPGLSTWRSFVGGLGFDALIYSTKMTIEEDLFSMKINNFNLTYIITANIGLTLGLGKFRAEDHWVGVAIIAKYRPSLNLFMGTSTIETISSTPYLPSSTTTTNIDPTSSFNLGGVGFDIEFSNYYATMSKLAPKPMLKVSAFVIPPVGDYPLFISIGLGLSIYKR